MNRRHLLLVAALPFAAFAGEATQTQGDVIVVEEAPPAHSAVAESAPREVPVRGMDMDNVRNVFGEPRQTHAAVGDPPITRWDYDGYSVFFEHDKVIHSVITE